MSFQGLALVFLGGGVGSALRFLISWAMKNQTQLNLPVATLTSNIISVIVFSIAYALIQQKSTSINESLRYLILIGFCGGLSTFSTFSFETFELFRRGETLWAWGNILLNNAICIGLIMLMVKRVSA